MYLRKMRFTREEIEDMIDIPEFDAVDQIKFYWEAAEQAWVMDCYVQNGISKGNENQWGR